MSHHSRAHCHVIEKVSSGEAMSRSLRKVPLATSCKSDLRRHPLMQDSVASLKLRGQASFSACVYSYLEQTPATMAYATAAED